MSKVTEEPDIDNFMPKHEPIVIRQVRSITGVDSLGKSFQKELKKMALDDVMQSDISLKKMVAKIKAMRPNTIVLENATLTLVIDCDIMLRDYAAIRKNKMVATGNYEDCAAALLFQIRKEFPDKFGQTTVKEIDDEFLKNFSRVHFNNDRQLRIASIK